MQTVKTMKTVQTMQTVKTMKILQIMKNMKKNINFFLAGVVGAGLVGIFIFAMVDKKQTDTAYHNLFSRDYRIFTPQMPAKMDFAGEEVPMNLFYVKEAFEREILVNTFYHSSTILMFKRANRWFPVIGPILKKNGIPDDFKFLALAESNFANVASPSGAEGFWQFLKPTGIKYGLEITDEVDERYNVEKATEAACRYFLEAYAEYKSWTLVAAAFNRGPDGVSKAIERQKISNYYDLYFVDETSRYVYRILAMKQIYYHPVLYGFYLREKEFYPQIPTYTISVDSTIDDLPSFALNMNINYRVLREFNPWLRRYNLPDKSKKTYVLKLPKEGYLRVEVLLKGIPQTEYFFHDTLSVYDIR